MKYNLSIIIIAANVESTIKDCLLSCCFAKEIILITNATDNTIPIAKQIIPDIKIFPSVNSSERYFDYSSARNLGLQHSTQSWILYVDDDERISSELKKQIVSIIKSGTTISNFDIPRSNFFMGHRVKHGGSYPDYVKRLFKKGSIHRFEGILHEQPVVTGLGGILSGHLLHYTHRNLFLMLNKSIIWTSLEADLIFKTSHPLVVWWRIIRMMFTKFFQRLIIQKMWRDGIVGWISVIFETFDTYMIYSQLYEFQLKHA
jgi:glycosyltransferase involved in cell wall biosynthesis